MRKKIKYGIDAGMMFLMITLMARSFTGGSNHELMGISMFALFVLHLLLNLPWFLDLKQRLRNSGNSFLNVTWLLVNFFLLLDFILLMVSAVIVSKELFGFLGIGHSRQWIFVHQAAAYAGFILMSVHLGMHWQMCMNSMRKSFGWKKGNFFRKMILRIAVILLVIGGISASFRRGIGEKFTYYTEEQREEKNPVQEDEQDYIGNWYFDYLCISGVYVAAAHYSLQLLNAVRKKHRKN